MAIAAESVQGELTELTAPLSVTFSGYLSCPDSFSLPLGRGLFAKASMRRRIVATSCWGIWRKSLVTDCLKSSLYLPMSLQVVKKFFKAFDMDLIILLNTFDYKYF
jgi:hypothetical protein